jgi:putative flippase GtrA
MMRLPDVVRRIPLSPQVLTFLAVGGAGYVVDVAVFNLLRSTATLGAWDPSVARVLAVAAAMVVTYLGNSLFTWRGESSGNRRREVSLFVVFNLIGLSISVLTLTVSHDLLGLTSRLADNISANVVGLALGTLFRYWSYKTFVFAHTGAGGATADEATLLLVSQSKGSGPDETRQHDFRTDRGGGARAQWLRFAERVGFLERRPGDLDEGDRGARRRRDPANATLG